MRKNEHFSFIAKCQKRTGWLRSKLCNFFVLMLFLVMFPSVLLAQHRAITGTVSDGNGESIIGVNVIEVGTTNGTITDVEGRFSLNVSSPTAKLQFRYIGYATKELSLDGKTALTVVLQEDTKALDEVVVVGFGTQKKVNLTGSVSVATSKDIEDRPVMLATQALQGLIPGLNISQNNGSLESRASINIRGTGTIGQGSSGSPLILIDGMEGDINAVNPQDIDNISVLKDAAASSIYGARAPFGVILITTKKGKEGKVSINYNNSFRWNKPILLPEMMDSYTFANYFNDASINSGGSAHFGDAWMNNILAYQRGEITTPTVKMRNANRWEEGFDPNGPNNTGGNDNRNYYKELFRSSAMSQEHNFSISGANDKINYYTAFNILGQDGLMKFNQDSYDRYAATVKLGYKATDWLNVNYSNRFTRTKYERPSSMTNYFYETIAKFGWPTMPLYDNNGHLLSRMAIGLRDGGTDKNETDILYQQIQGIFEPVKNWKTFVEMNYSTEVANRHWDSQTTYMHDVDGNPFVWSKNSNVHEDQRKENYLNTNIYTEYTLSIDNRHNLKAMAGMQYERMDQFLFGAQRDGILVPGINEIDGTSGVDWDGNPIVPSVNGSRNRWTTLGYFGRVNYDYQGRYLAEFNIRNDGSSRFRSGNRWVWSPSFSAGWNIAQEEFWKPINNIVEILKVRVSYGQLANQNTNSWYPTYAQMGIGAASGSWMMGGRKPNVAWSPGSIVEITPTWEKIRTSNIGLDFGLLKNRFTGSLDYYVRQTKDMIGPAPEMPAILGVGVPTTNNTDLKDVGFELQLQWRDQLKNGLGYGVRLTLSDYKTKITKYPNETGDLSKYRANAYTGQIWGYETIGIAKTQGEMDAHLASLPNGGQNALGSKWSAGDIMYKDLNNDGKINSGSYTANDPGDMKVLGNSTPRYKFGFELTADYKGFDFRAFFQGVLKRDYWQGNLYFWGATKDGLWHSAGLTDHQDYFRDETTNSVISGANAVNLDAYYPRPIFGDGKNQQVQSAYLQDASYIRLKNLQIGYTLPVNLTQKFAVSKLRVYVSGENLLTITDMADMFDPETIDGGWGGSTYPLSKVLSFGLSVNF